MGLLREALDALRRKEHERSVVRQRGAWPGGHILSSGREDAPAGEPAHEWQDAKDLLGHLGAAPLLTRVGPGWRPVRPGASGPGRSPRSLGAAVDAR